MIFEESMLVLKKEDLKSMKQVLHSEIRPEIKNVFREPLKGILTELVASNPPRKIIKPTLGVVGEMPDEARRGIAMDILRSGTATDAPRMAAVAIATSEKVNQLPPISFHVILSSSVSVLGSSRMMQNIAALINCANENLRDANVLTHNFPDFKFDKAEMDYAVLRTDSKGTVATRLKADNPNQVVEEFLDVQYDFSDHPISNSTVSKILELQRIVEENQEANPEVKHVYLFCGTETIGEQYWSQDSTKLFTEIFNGLGIYYNEVNPKNALRLNLKQNQEDSSAEDDTVE